MAELTALFNSRSGSVVRIGAIQLDAVLNEVESMSAKVTDFPVEDGVSVSDHVLLEPVTITINGLVTDSPIQFFSALQFVSGTNVEGGSRAKSQYDGLRDLYEKRQPFTIVTGFTVRENMIITNLSVPRTPATGQAMRFTATARQIRKISAQTVAIPKEQVSDTNNASTVDKGKVVADAAAEKVEEKATSFLKDWFGEVQ